MALSTDSAVALPSAAHRFNEDKLVRYLSSSVDELSGLRELAAKQFSHGQSNPTYLLETNLGKFVMRKKPPGHVLASAHAVDREHRILAALAGTHVPVPQVICLCQDESVLGTPFYVMQHVQGRIFTDVSMPTAAADERQAAYFALAATLGKLHSVKPAEVGLGNYSRNHGYCARQVWRWKQQYMAQLDAEPLQEMQQLIQWLETHVPAADSNPSETRISHGDYRLDNVVLHPHDAGQVLAVLDWELSALGYPVADLAYCCLAYHLDEHSRSIFPALSEPLPAGIPSEQEFIEAYCRERGCTAPDKLEWTFCIALSLFRCAAIVAGIGARARMGNASSKNALQAGSPEVVRGLARVALKTISQAEHSVTGSAHHEASQSSFQSHAGVTYGPSTAASSKQKHAAFHDKDSSHADVAYSPQSSSRSHLDKISPSTPHSSGQSHAAVSYGPSTSASSSDTHAAFPSISSSHAEVAYSPYATSGSLHDNPRSPASSQQHSKEPAQSGSDRSSQQEGTVEGINDEGSTKTGPAVSMSHPNAAFFQSQQVRRTDTSASQLSHLGVAEGQMEGTNDAGSVELKPVASMSHPNSALLQSDNTGADSNKQQSPQTGSGPQASNATSNTDRHHEGGAKLQGPQGLGSGQQHTMAESRSNKDDDGGAQSEGSVEGVSDEGSMQNTPASSMSHPSSAFKQAQQLRRNGTSATVDRLTSSASASSSGFDPPQRDPATKWKISPLNEQLKLKAKAAGLWNLWLPADLKARLAHLAGHAPQEEASILLGAGLSNLEYAYLSEIMGRSVWASEIFNCSAPDTGNMEVLARYGSVQQQERWLLPLLRGQIRSCFAMTEPEVASSDATNIRSAIHRKGAGYVVRGHKWWASGAMDPRCAVAIFMGKTDPQADTYRQQSMILVPMDAPGVCIIRPLDVFGYDDAPHGHAEVMFEDVEVPAGNLLLGEGRGFEIAQGRLGPGRLHHCMRMIGMGNRSVELMALRALERIAFKGPIASQGAFRSQLATCRVELDAARLTVLAAADALDKQGNKKARGQIAAAKYLTPNTVLKVIDTAIQVHGGAGVCNDFVLASLWAGARTLRIADGPDDVHLLSIAKLELSRASKL
ncbi:hypothetical protein WJX74_005074 [Apatococcus lobatus]|uniref:Acyl-CoA dehydrogenase n=1 Tax=Apatococcus lobatus TaxID=904363 RepID=A0AAW1SGR3_9CHLO